MFFLPGCSCCSPCGRLANELWGSSSIELDVTAGNRLTHRRRTWLWSAMSCPATVGTHFGITDWFPGGHYSGRLSLVSRGESGYFSSGQWIQTKTYSYEYEAGVDGCCAVFSPSAANPNGLPYVAVVLERNLDFRLTRARILFRLSAAYHCNRSAEQYLQTVPCDPISQACPGIIQSSYVGALADQAFLCNATTGLPTLTSTASVGLSGPCPVPSDEGGSSASAPVIVSQTGPASVTVNNVEFIS